jgi:phospholipase/carboxylesterase
VVKMPSMNEPLEVVMAGGVDGRGAGSGPLVVLLHGFGAPGTDLVGMHRSLSVVPGLRFAFPAGLLDLSRVFGGDARAWWSIDIAERMARAARGLPRDPNEVPDGMDAAADVVAAWLNSARADGPLVLGGFSQGAMLALEVALRLEKPPQALALLSSTLLAEGRQKPLLSRLQGTPIFQSHGREDSILAFGDAEKLHVHLTGASLNATFLPFSGGHEIPPAALRGLAENIRLGIPG